MLPAAANGNETMTKIAFLGTGLMGEPMARNLLKAGFDLTVWNRTQDKALPLGAAGARIAPAPQDAVRGAGIVVTMLSDGEAVSDLLFGRGCAAAMAAGTLVIDMSSIRPREARDHAGRLAAAGIGHLDAPVSGGTRGAEAADLAIMAGGDPADFARAEPVLRAMGRPVLVGPAGAGQLSKLANQAIVAITIGAVAEATLLVRRAGADPRLFRQALEGGFADSIILRQHGERMETGDFAPGGRASIQLKDLDNILDEARALGIALPLVSALRDRFHRLVHDMGHGELDHAALFLELLDRNGLPAGDVKTDFG